MFILSNSFTLVQENAHKNIEKAQTLQSKPLQKPGTKKALYFVVGINITTPNYLFIPNNCLKILFRTYLVGDRSYLSQQNILSGHMQSLADISSMFFLIQLFLIYVFII